MIESLAEHGVRADDLVPALMATHTVKNPEYDPKAAKEAEREQEHDQEYHAEEDAPPPYEPSAELPYLPIPRETTPPGTSPPPLQSRSKPINPFGSDDEESGELGTPQPRAISPGVSSGSRALPPLASPEPRRRATNPFGSDDEEDMLPPFASSSKPASATHHKPSAIRKPSFDMDDDEGDIGRSASPPPASLEQSALQPKKLAEDQPTSPGGARDRPDQETDPERTPRNEQFSLPELGDDEGESRIDTNEEEPLEEAPALPSLPGVSTSLTSADENVVLDIRWTVVSSIHRLVADPKLTTSFVICFWCL
jgi:hypothetical protein